MDVPQSASSIRSPLEMPAPSRAADSGGMPPSGSAAETGGGSSVPEFESMDMTGADTSVPERDTDLGAGILSTETETTKTPA